MNLSCVRARAGVTVVLLGGGLAGEDGEDDTHRREDQDEAANYKATRGFTYEPYTIF